MKRIRKLLNLILILVLAAGLGACSSATNSRTSQARKSVEEFWKYSTDFNFKEASKYTDQIDESQLQALDLESAPEEYRNLLEVSKGVYEGSTLTYSSGEIAEEDTEGTLVYTYTGKNPEEYMSYLQNNFSPEDFVSTDFKASDIIKEINDSGLESVKTNLTFTLHYDDNEDIWKIDDVYSEDGEFSPLNN